MKTETPKGPMDLPVMQFDMEHAVFKSVESFSEHAAPTWLTGDDTPQGSTMDTRWFWRNLVLTLSAGSSVETDFHKITRTA